MGARERARKVDKEAGRYVFSRIKKAGERERRKGQRVTRDVGIQVEVLCKCKPASRNRECI